MASSDNTGRPPRGRNTSLRTNEVIPWGELMDAYYRVLSREVQEVEGSFWRVEKKPRKIVITIWGSLP